MSTAEPHGLTSPAALPAGHSVASPVAPHPMLGGYYQTTAGKRSFLREIFDATATDYDKVERVLALGTGRWHRRKELQRAGLAAGMRVLDVAMGTGLVAREAASLAGDPSLVLGVDPSAGMLAEARRSLGVQAVLGVGEALPVADASFDFVSMGYALRHLPDLAAAFGEFHRVLKPGGRVCILEISRPRGAIRHALVAGYFRGVLPVLSRLVGTTAKTRELWRYYWDTIDACVAPEVVQQSLREAGFTDVSHRAEFGIFSTYMAMKN